MLVLLQENKILQTDLLKKYGIKDTGPSILVLCEYINKVIAKKKKKVLVLKSGTGTGKSTLIPPYLWRLGDKKRNILLTQPVTLNTKSITTGIATYNPDLIMGQNIGYRTGTITNKIIGRGGIEAITNGILRIELENNTPEKLGQKYSYILIDEAHKTSPELEEIFIYMKKYINNPAMPTVVFMSGTIDTDSFIEYLGLETDQALHVAMGDSFPIQDMYPSKPVKNVFWYVNDTVTSITKRNDKPTENHVLVFVHGTAELLDYQKTFSSLPGCVAIGITREKISSNSPDMKILEDPTETRRKIVLATNAIETGVTIDGLQYCIDTGFVKENYFNPIYGGYCLIDRSIDKFSMVQRRGRVGRTFPGTYYPCYPKSVIDSFPPGTDTKMITQDISRFILTYLYKQPLNPFTDSILNIDSIQSIPIQNICYSLKYLWNMGLIDDSLSLTKYGIMVKKIGRLSVMATALIIYGLEFTNIHIEDLVIFAVFLDSFKDYGRALGKVLNFYLNDIGITEQEYKRQTEKSTIPNIMYSYLVMKHFIHKAFIESENVPSLDFWSDKLNLAHKKIENLFTINSDVLNNLIRLNIFKKPVNPPRKRFESLSMAWQRDIWFKQIELLLYYLNYTNVFDWDPIKKYWTNIYSGMILEKPYQPGRLVALDSIVMGNKKKMKYSLFVNNSFII